MQSKKGASATQVIIIFVALAILGTTVYFGVKGGQTEGVIVPAQQSLTEAGPVVTTAKVSCPSDGTTSGQIRYEDNLAATTTYGTPTCYFFPKTAGLEMVSAGSLSSSDWSTAVDLKCTESGTKWRTICVTDSDDWSSADEGSDFVAEGSYVKRELSGKNFENLQMKAEDKLAGTGVMFNFSCYGDPDGAGYSTFASTTGCNLTNHVSYTSLTIGADEYIDAAFFLKTNATKGQFGEDGLRTFMVVNADASDWSEPIVGWLGQPALSNQLANMEYYDRQYYSGYEYAYDIGVIGDREKQLDFFMQTASGVNADMDPVINFCAEGRYKSSKDADTIKVGCWTDAASQTQVATATTDKVTIDVT